MKRFLLLALTAGLLSPIAANAETIYLVISTEGTSLDKIEMKDMNQCLEQGELYRKTTPNQNHRQDPKSQGIAATVRTFICLKGK